MIKTYHFSYEIGSAEAEFSVDSEKFTSEMAQELLDFFSWNYDEDGDPIEEILKKYAMMVIKLATNENVGVEEIIKYCLLEEGILPLDGSQGVQLKYVEAYEFDDELLELTVEDSN